MEGRQLARIGGLLLRAAFATTMVLHVGAQSQTGQVWRDMSGAPCGRRGIEMVFDPARGRAVMFGGVLPDGTQLGDTWEWQSGTWHPRSFRTEPGARSGHALAFDPVRQCVLLFGGAVGQTPVDDTWSYDGSSWSQLQPSARPYARRGHRMVTDTIRNRVVLFGGILIGGWADTWEWDGTNWLARSTPVAPPDRWEHSMAFDSARARTVLFGGWWLHGRRSDTWEWDGNTWSQRAVTTGPPARSNAAMVYDNVRNRTLLVGGSEGSAAFDTWEWDGTTWQRPTVQANHSISQGAMTIDPGAACPMLVGTPENTWGEMQTLCTTWHCFATGWTELLLAPRLYGHAMAHDWQRGVTVLFGGRDYFTASGDTWEWAGSNWVLRTRSGPSARSGHSMSYDLVRQRTVLFGGGWTAETWEWNGATWAFRTQAGPALRQGCSLAYDLYRGVTVLFGGEASSDGTWVWDGNAWRQAASAANSPPRRQYSAMAFDFVRGKTVLFGGSTGSALLDDTWEWDGAVWQCMMPAHRPRARIEAAMVFDPTRCSAVLLEGSAVNAIAGNWEWDGVDWRSLNAPAGPGARKNHAAVYDMRRSRLTLHGGEPLHPSGPSFAYGDTWELGGTGRSIVGPGCSGSAGIPLLAVDSASRVGGVHRATVTGMSGTASMAALVYGSSISAASFGPLPLELNVLGMPGCMLRVSPEVIAMVPAQGGCATFAVDIPDSAALRGLCVYEQALCDDPGWNAGGAVLSNALSIVIDA